jgi:hypothetical protein
MGNRFLYEFPQSPARLPYAKFKADSRKKKISVSAVYLLAVYCFKILHDTKKGGDI